MSMWVSLFVGCALIALTSVPMMLGRVPPNRLYGFRTRRTLSRAEIWYPANRFAGACLFVAAIVSFAGVWMLRGRVPPTSVWLIVAFAGPFVGALVASLIYLRRLG